MEVDQAVRKLGRDLRARVAGAYAAYVSARAARASAAADAAADDEPQSGPLAAASWRVRNSVFAAFTAVAALIVIYPLWAWSIGIVDDDLSFAPKPSTLSRNQSAALAAVGALMDREVNQHDWTPNAPFFSPAALLEDMPNFQRGMVASLAHVTGTFSALVGTAPDPDLKNAAELLNYPPDVWLWNPMVSLFSGSSEQQYRKAIDALASYNARLVSGDAAFDRSPAALEALLESIAADLKQTSGTIEDYIRDHAGVALDGGAGHVFYGAKGGLYADAIVLKTLAGDFSAVIEARGLSKAWDATLARLEESARMHPYAVMNGAPDSSFVPCHLCNQGFYLSRAREGLDGLADALKK